MFWGKKNKEAEKVQTPQAAKVVEQPTKVEAPSTSAGKESHAVHPPETTAIFEFGGVAAEGIRYKGVCRVDDPDLIQACEWRVEPVEESSQQKYRIEF